MHTINKQYIIVFFSFLSLAFTTTTDDIQETASKKIASNNFHNLYKLNDSMYRSEQPTKKGMRELQAMGIQSIVNFRRQATDAKKIKGLNLDVDRIPLKASTIDFDESKEKTIAEFTDIRFGYHRTRFSNLITLLDTLDVDRLKEKLAAVRLSKLNKYSICILG